MKTVVLILLSMALLSSIADARPWYLATNRNRPSNQYRAYQRPITQPAPTLPPAQAAAKADIDRMADVLNRAIGIQYDAAITYPMGPTTAPVQHNISVSVVVEREARMLIQTTNNGVEEGDLSATGTLLTLYDAPSSSYSQVITSEDLWSLQQALELAGKDIYPKPTYTGKGMSDALAFPLIFLEKDYDDLAVGNGVTLAYSAVSSTSPDGKPVILATQTFSSAVHGSVAATYMIDSATNLPVQMTQIETRPGKAAMFDLQETFTNFKLIHRNLPNTTFSYSPPLTAKQIR